MGGALSGRRFPGPVTVNTRPTSERVREAIGSIVQSRGGWSGRRVLDLYAGTGAMAFEALSRGALSAVLVEADGKAVRSMRQASMALALSDRTTFVQGDIRTAPVIERLRALALRFDRVFLDPPYDDVADLTLVLERLRDALLLADDCILALEHRKQHAPILPHGFAPVLHPSYGDTRVLIAHLTEET